MSVRKIRNSWWVDFRVNFTRYRKKSPENTRAGALAWEAHLRQKLAKGEAIATSALERELTLGDFAREWFNTYVRANNRPQEQRTKECALRNHLLPRFGHMPLRAIGARDIEHFKAVQLARGLSPKSINNELAILRKCLASAAEWGHRADVPTVKWLSVPCPAPRRLDPDAAARLLAAPAPAHWRAMITLALRTGLRAGELLGLRWEDIDLVRSSLTVRHSMVRGVLGAPKNGRKRSIPLSASARDALVGLPRSAAWVFPNADGDALTYTAAARALQRACSRAGIAPTTWHVLRHTFASELVDKAVPLRHVQELLGHGSIAMTERYTHLTAGSLEAAVAQLDRPHAQTTPPLPWATGGQRDSGLAPVEATTTSAFG